MIRPLVVALSLSGCAALERVEPGDSFDAEGFSAEQELVLAEALAGWNESAPELGLSFVDKGTWHFVARKNAVGAVAWFHTSEPVVTIDLELLAKRDHMDWLLAVAMHELGHTLGIGDLDDGLMAPGQAGARPACVDKAAVEALAKVRSDVVFRVTCAE